MGGGREHSVVKIIHGDPGIEVGLGPPVPEKGPAGTQPALQP